MTTLWNEIKSLAETPLDEIKRRLSILASRVGLLWASWHGDHGEAATSVSRACPLPSKPTNENVKESVFVGMKSNVVHDLRAKRSRWKAAVL